MCNVYIDHRKTILTNTYLCDKNKWQQARISTCLLLFSFGSDALNESQVLKGNQRKWNTKWIIDFHQICKRVKCVRTATAVVIPSLKWIFIWAEWYFHALLCSIRFEIASHISLLSYNIITSVRFVLRGNRFIFLYEKQMSKKQSNN